MTLRLVLAAAATLAPLATAHAGGFGIPEMGVRRTAMAAVIGRPDEPTAVYHNPAGLTLMPGVRVYMNMGVAMISSEFQLRPWEHSDEILPEFTPDGDGYYAGVRPTRAIGAIPMLAATFELIPNKLWGAASLYVSNASGAQFDREAVTRYHLVDGYVVAPTVQANVAYKLNPQWSFGAGVGLLNVRVHGNRYVWPYVSLNGTETDLSSIVGTNPELTLDGSDWVVQGNAGVLWQPTPKVSVGASVISRTNPDVTGPIRLEYGDDAPDPDYFLEGTATTHMLLPWTFGLGANVDVHPNVEIGTELRYYLYRQFDEQVTDIQGIFLLNQLVTPKNYHDSIQVSGGVRVHDLAFAPSLELMLGTHYDRTPAPPSTVTLENPSFPHVGLHSGLRYGFGRYRAGLSYTLYKYFIPTITDSLTAPPSNARGNGTNNIFTLSIEAAFGGSK